MMIDSLNNKQLIQMMESGRMTTNLTNDSLKRQSRQTNGHYEMLRRGTTKKPNQASEDNGESHKWVLTSAMDFEGQD